MHEQVENIERFMQRTTQQHPAFFQQVRLWYKRGQAKSQGEDEQKRERKLVDFFYEHDDILSSRCSYSSSAGGVMSIDKRKIKRHKKRLQLRYGLNEANKLGFTEDISPTGIFIRSPVVMNPGKILNVEFTLPGDAIILVRARIMWAKRVPQNLLTRVKGGMGVHILTFEQGEEEYLQLCKSLNR
jgi:hypothetical protein